MLSLPTIDIYCIVAENIIGAPKMKTNFQCTIKLFNYNNGLKYQSSRKFHKVSENRINVK